MKIFRWALFLALAVSLALSAAPVAAKTEKKSKEAGPRTSYSSYKDAYEAGNKALETREFDKAAAAYAEAVKLAPSETSKSKSSNAKGWALLKARKLADAQAAFEQASQFDPKNTLAFSNLANASLNMYQSGLGDETSLKKAQEALETCKKIDPNFKAASCDQVKAALDRIAAWAQATPVAGTPKSGMGYKAAVKLGDEAQANGQFDLAVQAFAIAEKDANSSVAKGSAANRQGKALMDSGRPVEAVVHFERALGYEPQEKVFLNNMGFAQWTLYDSGQGGVEALKSAVEYFAKSNAVDASYKAENLQMALTELQSVDPDAAKAYEKAEAK